MWVIDIRHWLDDTQSGPAVPQLRLKVKKIGEIITYATSAGVGIAIDAPPKCWRRPNRKPCDGILEIHLNQTQNQIHWRCNTCQDEGIVTGWEGLIWDMSEFSSTIH